MRFFGYVPVPFSRLYEWGRINVEWDLHAARTSPGLVPPPFFYEILKMSEVFAPCGRDRPLTDQSPNSQQKSDVLEAILLSI